MSAPWRVACAARGLTPRWALTVGGAWASVLVLAAITIPLKYPHDLHGAIVDTGLVVGLTVPVAAMARTLDEGALHLVQTASLRLSRHRAAWAIGLLAATGIVAAALSAVLPIPTALVVADAVLFAGAALVAAAVLGGDLAWTLPLALAGVASAPGVVPWSVNVLYRHTLAGTTLAIAAVTAAVGIGLYAWRGSVGPHWRGRLGRADAHVGQE